MLLAFFIGVGNMWGATKDMVYTYTFASSAAQVAGPTEDEFFTATAPTQSGEYTAKANDGNLRYQTGTAGAETTLSFQFTAKGALNISAITLNCMGNSDKITGMKIRYKVNSGSWSSDQAITAKKSSLEDRSITLPSKGVELAEDDVFTLQIDLKNTDTGTNNRGWDIHTITIAAEEAGDPKCPTTVTISGTQTYTVGDKITLNAATDGNGDLTYQWYKGGTAESNKLAGKTVAKLEIEGCALSDAGDYYCEIGKEGCTPASVFNTAAYAIEVNPLGADLTAHTPGLYEKAQASGGYGAALITIDGRDYETYYIGNTSKLYVSAGNKSYSADGHYNVIDNATFSADTEIKGEDWLTMSANSLSNVSSVNTGQFNINGTVGMLKMRKTTQKIRLKVSGYDQFAFLGKNNSSSTASQQFAITIDGVSKENPWKSSNSDKKIFSFDLTTGEHYIEISVGGTSSSDSQFEGFSLRLPATCTLTLNPNGGAYAETPAGWTYSEGVYTKSVTKGATYSASLPAAGPTKSGSSFNQWMTTSTSHTGITGSDAINADVTIYAEWKGEITYNKGGDTYAAADLAVDNPATYVEGVGVASFTDLANIDGYDFDGWSPASIGTDATGAQAITATWVPAATKHNITYAGYGSADMSGYPTQYSEGVGIASFEPLEDTEDEHFLGWSPASIGAEATTDQTITATWEAKKVVTFNSNGGSSVAAVKVVRGETVAAPTAPTRTNYTFKKWQKGGVDYDFATAVTEDITLDAVWERDEIEGEETEEIIVDANKNPNASLTNPEYGYSQTYTAKGDYALTGGMYGGDSGKRYIKFTIPSGYTGVAYLKGTKNGTRKLVLISAATKAVHDAASGDAKTQFNDESECEIYISLSSSTNTADGTSGTLQPGDYWVTASGGGLNINSLIITLTADPMSVKLKVNGEVTETITVKSGEKLGEIFVSGALPVLSLDGYTFNGWKNEEDDEAVTNNTEITKSMVIYADLSAATYNVTLSKGTNASTAGAATIKMGAGALTITSATAGTGALKGFYTTSSGDVKVAEANGTLVTGDVTGFVTDGKWSKAADAELFAQYAPSYAVKFFPGYGENTQIGETQSILGGSYAVAPADPEREGFKFLGWSITTSKDDIKTVATYAISGATNFTAIWQEKFKVTYYDGTTKLGEEVVLDGESPAHSGDYEERMLADFDGWYNNADLEEEHKITSVAALEIDANANIYGKWTKTYAQDIDFVAKIGTDGKTFNYATFLSDKGYLLTQGTGHENELDNNNAFDTGLKLKNSTDNKLQFRAAEGKLVKVVMGKVSGMTYSVNGATAKNLNGGTDKDHLGVTYMYSAGEQEITLEETATAYNMIKSITITDAPVVTYNATTNGGTCASDKAVFQGTALTLPAAEKDGSRFDGWFTTADDETETGTLVGLGGASYTPAASITLYARFTATTSLATLTDIKVNGTTITGFAADKYEYTIEFPYKTASIPTIAYTRGYEGEGGSAGEAVTMSPDPITAVFGDVTLHVVSEDGTVERDYVLHFTEAPKDMLCIISAKHTNATTATVTGYIGGTADKSTSGSSKLGSKGNYFGITLAKGTFQAGDVVMLRTATGADTNGDKVRIFKSNAASEENVLVEGTAAMVYGDNYVTLPATDLATIYIRRGTEDEAYNNDWNPYIDVFAVYRPFPKPLLTGIKIDEAVAVVDENDATVYNVTIPAGSNLASLDVVPTFLSNDPSQTNGAVSGSWTTGPNTYVVTDKDGDSKSYTINIVRDVAVESVTVSGETTVAAKSQITLTATVLPANVANKAVTWSSSDETKATVDANGVVTGKAAGSVTITATSVADNTKKGTLDIEVTKFVGTERVYWFAYADDAEANGVENNSEVFGSAPTGTTNGAQEITLEEGWVVNTTKKAGSSTLGSFTVPADFTATLYVVVKGSGSSGRYIQLKQSDVVKYTSEEFGSADPTVLKIDGVTAGTYTIANVGGLSNFYLYAAELNSYPLTSIALEESFNLRLGQSRTPVFTLTPTKAAVVSQVWSEVSRTGASDATFSTTTGEISAGNEEGTITVNVTVTDAFGNEAESGNCVVNIVNIIEQKDVTGPMTWDWTDAGTANVAISSDDALALGNYISGDEWAYIKGTKNDYAYNTNNGGCYQGVGTLSFNTTVDGVVRITARRISKDATLKIGEKTVGTLTDTKQTFAPIFVRAGEVNIIADATDGMRILKVEFMLPGYEEQEVNTGETNVSTLKDGADVTVHDGATLTIDGDKVLNDLTIEPGGEVVLSSNKLTVVGMFSIETTMASGESGQLRGATANNFAAQDAYIDITLGAGGTSAQWHAFTVPFPVDALNGVYDQADNKLTNEVNYAIMDYHGDIRANGDYGWKKYRGILQPGTFYLMTVDGDRTTYRFRKVAGADIVATNSISYAAYQDGDGVASDKGWNGIGNPTLFYGQINIAVQVLNPNTYTYEVKTANSTNFVVGTPFFYQATAAGSISMSAASGNAFYAPKRQTENEIKDVDITFGNEVFSDHLYISAREEATNNYEIGKDLSKMMMTSTPSVAQIYGKAYGTNLCMIDAPMVNNEATYKFTLYAPTAAEYTITAPNMENVDIYLTKDDAIIWKISEDGYTLDMPQGFTTGYGILLKAKAPAVTTGVENTPENASGVQKVVIDDHVYILRGEKMYDTTGKMVK